MVTFESNAQPAETDICTYTFQLSRPAPGNELIDVTLELPFSVYEMGCIATAHGLVSNPENALNRTATENNGLTIDRRMQFNIPWGWVLTDREWTIKKLSVVDERIQRALEEPAGSYDPDALSELLAMRLALQGVLGDNKV